MIEGARTYHVSLSRDRAMTALGVVHNPRHFIVYRLGENKNAIDIGRILRDDRELVRHLPEGYRRGGARS
jgi:toxin ParE1/3/4